MAFYELEVVFGQHTARFEVEAENEDEAVEQFLEYCNVFPMEIG
jgi:hypothetical protein